MTEQQIQKKAIDIYERNGYYVIKLMKTNKNGIPDLIAIPHHSSVVFIEVKRPKKKPTKLQKYRMEELNNHGISTVIYDGDTNEED